MTNNTPPTPLPLEHPALRILIVGAGVGGLAMANLLEAAGYDYLILEKASEFKPLGSAISLSHFSFPFLHQLGIYEDLVKVAKPFRDLILNTVNLETGKVKRRGVFNPEAKREEKYGFPTMMFARPDLMEALLRKVPKSKILMKKRVVSSQQTKDGVVVHTEDGSKYSADLLVGADGCYSPVRKSMFAEVEKRKELPTKDNEALRYDIDCIVGITEPLDPQKFPDVATEICDFQVVLPEKQKVSIWWMPLSRNRMGWMINEAMTDERKAEIGPIYGNGNNNNKIRPEDWDAGAAMEMCKRYGNYPTPYGTTLQTFIDKTPTELISKVLLEEKFFETWQDGRTCLIGDACHKVLPFGAVGATTAMLDAVQLTNLIYDLKDNSYESIREMLVKYQEDRKPHGRDAVNGSTVGSRLFHSRGLAGSILRFIVLHLVPKRLMEKGMEAHALHRPQSGFLPYVHLGTSKHNVIAPCVRYVMEQQQGGVKKFAPEVPAGRDGDVPEEAAVV